MKSPSGEPDRSDLPDDALRQEVENLATAVLGTAATLKAFEKKYPPRDEVKRDRRRAVYSVLTAVAVAVIGAMLLNNREINQCFLQGSLQHSAICNTLFPGYNKSVDTQNERLAQFQELIEERENFAEENRARIAEIEKGIEERAQVRTEQIAELQRRVAELEAAR